MNIKNPIYLFGGLVFLFGLFVLFFILGLWGIYTVLYLYGSYAILMGISFIINKLKVEYRRLYEISLIALYVAVLTLSYLHWDVGSELYFEDNPRPFVGKDQHFIIIFGIDGHPELQDNSFTDNEIYIPQSGILLTSSMPDSYQHRYYFDDRSISERFYTSYFEQWECYGKANYKYKYVVGVINDSAKITTAHRDSLLNLVCQRLNRSEIKSSLAAGYEQGSYLDQKEIIINYKGLVALPEGLTELKNLEYLNIHSNNLGTIPDEVYQFKNLKKLYIGFNKIQELPAKIGTLQHLESLAVNGNELTDLPDTLLSIRSLKYISIRENGFSAEKLKELNSKYKARGIELQY